jgi:hypothetical protein
MLTVVLPARRQEACRAVPARAPWFWLTVGAPGSAGYVRDAGFTDLGYDFRPGSYFYVPKVQESMILG